MANHYWYPWQPPPPPPPPNMLARPRSQYEPSSSGVPVRASMDTLTIGEVPTLGEIGIANRMPFGSRMPGPSIPPAPFVMNRRPPAFSHDFATIRPENMPLPHNACNCLYVTGLPENCSRREIAHIFRPFEGYIRVRLTLNKIRLRGEDPLLLCFVDFANAAYAAAAMRVLQGYRMDEQDPKSKFLRIKFALYPAPNYGSGSGSQR